MSDQFPNDEDVLARLVSEAGDPSVSPDPEYAETLRATILDRVNPAETIDHVVGHIGEEDVIPIDTERTRTMKRITRFAVAATVLIALGILASWMSIGGGSGNIAFAEVAKALDNLRTATFDETVVLTNPMDGKQSTDNSKTLFMAPSRQRCEMSMPGAPGSVMILDVVAMKAITLFPDRKLATTIDLTKMEKPAGTPPNMFELVRRIVQERSSGQGHEVESLGKKEIDGRVVVGFRTRDNMMDMTLWADPQTARPVQIELDLPSHNTHSVMSNFRYDVELDPALFSLEPPAGYTVKNVAAKTPTEDDLINILRLIAKYNDGTFPPAIGMNKEYMQAVQAESKKEGERLAQELLKKPETQKLRDELKAQYGDDKTGFMKAWMKEYTKLAEPNMLELTQRHMQGVLFYMMLRPENDSHYVGKDVNLNTPDRPILWYKPTGADKYRVIYADLSVRDMTPDDVKKLPEAKAK